MSSANPLGIVQDDNVQGDDVLCVQPHGVLYDSTKLEVVSQNRFPKRKEKFLVSQLKFYTLRLRICTKIDGNWLILSILFEI